MIRVWNRAEQREEVERVYGDAGVRFLYGNRLGQGLVDHFLSGKAVSKLYGVYQSSGMSQRKIEPFIQEFGIRMEEFEGAPYRSFNDFFIRRFKNGARVFAEDPRRMPAFAEARYLAFDSVTDNQRFPVKGSFLTAPAILGNRELAQPFIGGALMIARLCPTDYHRFHYPDEGKTWIHYNLSGKLHSVNPLALRYKDEIFATNERHVSILETENFGKLAYVEVGALCVGKIVQTHPWDRPFARGTEKGYFLFGGSTVILLGEKGRWTPDADLLARSEAKQESFVKLGAAVAHAV